MGRPLIHQANAPAQGQPTREQLIETLLSKKHECNTLIQQIQQVIQLISALRMQLQRISVNGTADARFQTDNVQMLNYVRHLHGEYERLQEQIENQKETLDGLRKELNELMSQLRTA